MAILVIIIVVLTFVLLWQYMKYRKYKYLHDRSRAINDIFINVSEELSGFYDINILYNQLLQNTLGLIEGAEAGSILIYNPEKNYMEYKASTGFNFEELKNLFLRKEELFLYKINQLKNPEIVRNPMLFDSKNLKKNNFELLVSTNSLDIKCTMTAPLYVNGEFYGVINVDSKSSENAFNKNDIRNLQYICRQLEIAIKNVLLMNELIKALRVDKLTDIYNRRYFEELTEDFIREGEGLKKPFCLVMMDLDDFKLINDTYGHKLGDDALKFFSGILCETRGENDIVARYAGDEFVMVFDGETHGAAQRIEHIRSLLGEFGRSDVKISFSAGICRYEEGYDLDRLITLADMEMYRDKRERKGKKECCCP